MNHDIVNTEILKSKISAFLEKEINILCDELKNKQGITDTIIVHNAISLHPPPETPASEDITQKSIINNCSLNTDSKNDSEKF